MPRYRGSVVLTTREEAPAGAHIPLLYEESVEEHPTVLAGLILQKAGAGAGERELVIGIDPGSRTGLSVFYLGREIESSIHSTTEGLVSHIITVLAGLSTRRKIVRIGNGSMPAAKAIGAMLNLRFCSSFELEFVDEYGTSPRSKNNNQAGKRDRLSARYISQRTGRRRVVLPHSMTG
ncbi:hypothetical protein CENSYa_1744 [Cenarchaeum symbiosum A]|uniref:Uncharacterized protein n=1 Tax=Cenarchaeum symbiosum (strain A) TaxID=414004 RepID=A0RYD8_CENSY|nr:hypothetical protein CENSYa_1744 [Cenarchaeum symbiosum A]